MQASLHRQVLALALAFGVTLPTAAQEAEGVVVRTGTLKKIEDTGVIRLGHRENSIPFSFRNARGQPIGYAIDLCNAIVEDIAYELDGREIRVEYRPVTPENRFDLLVAGEIDLECGSTTNNLERRKRVAFSPLTFVTGTKLMVKRDSRIRSVRELRGKTIALTRGTTNEAAMKATAARQTLDVKFVSGSDHNESFELLAAGRADAFGNDDVLLYGLLAERKLAGQYRVVGDYLSFDPYGLMFRKDDPAFAEVVERTFRRLAESREIVWIYEKWFLKQLPSGIRLNLPVSPQLEESFKVLGLPE
jgi:ABC-type amino acid transport substrate-binding protein